MFLFAATMFASSKKKKKKSSDIYYFQRERGQKKSGVRLTAGGYSVSIVVYHLHLAPLFIQYLSYTCKYFNCTTFSMPLMSAEAYLARQGGWCVYWSRNRLFVMGYSCPKY